MRPSVRENALQVIPTAKLQAMKQKLISFWFPLRSSPRSTSKKRAEMRVHPSISSSELVAPFQKMAHRLQRSSCRKKSWKLLKLSMMNGVSPNFKRDIRTLKRVMTILRMALSLTETFSHSIC